MNLSLIVIPGYEPPADWVEHFLTYSSDLAIEIEQDCCQAVIGLSELWVFLESCYDGIDDLEILRRLSSVVMELHIYWTPNSVPL